MRYFLYCFIGMGVYFWFPGIYRSAADALSLTMLSGYIFQALSFFNWIVWIDPMVMLSEMWFRICF